MEKRKRKWFSYPEKWCYHKGWWSGVTVAWVHDKKYDCKEIEPKLTNYKLK